MPAEGNGSGLDQGRWDPWPPTRLSASHATTAPLATASFGVPSRRFGLVACQVSDLADPFGDCANSRIVFSDPFTNILRHALLLRRRFGMLIRQGVATAVCRRECLPIAEEASAHLMRASVGGHPHHLAKRNIIGRRKQQREDAGEGALPCSSPCLPTLEGVDDRPAVEPEGRARLSTESRLEHGPSFGTWDVDDPVWQISASHGDDSAVHVRDYEGPTQSEQALTSSVESGAIGVHDPDERLTVTRRSENPLEGWLNLRWWHLSQRRREQRAICRDGWVPSQPDIRLALIPNMALPALVV